MRMTLAVLACVAAFSACRDQPESPAWLNDRIGEILAEPISNPPTQLYRFRYNGQTVIYRPPRCCDQFSEQVGFTQYGLSTPSSLGS